MFRKSVLCLARGISGWSFNGATTARILYKEPLKIEINNNNCRALSMSSVRNDLMEFFDTKKNWGENIIRVGRSWKVDELRLKSNTDLHKLWYILLKEKNMLLTMEHACKVESEFFPNPERIDKVEESMKNLEDVVRERNRAYFMLETGESGERPGAEEENFLGLPEYQQHKEYDVPKELNKDYLKAKSEEPVVDPAEKTWFLARWGEKQRLRKKYNIRQQKHEIIQIMKKFPNVDIVALKEKFPDVPERMMNRLIETYIKDKHLGNLRPLKFYGHTKY